MTLSHSTKVGDLVLICYDATSRELPAFVGHRAWPVKRVLRDGRLKVAGWPDPVKSWVRWSREDFVRYG